MPTANSVSSKFEIVIRKSLIYELNEFAFNNARYLRLTIRLTIRPTIRPAVRSIVRPTATWLGRGRNYGA